MDSRQQAANRLGAAKEELSQASTLAGAAVRDTAEAGRLELNAAKDRLSAATTPSSTYPTSTYTASTATDNTWLSGTPDQPITTRLGESLHDLEDKVIETGHNFVEGLKQITGFDHPSTGLDAQARSDTNARLDRIDTLFDANTRLDDRLDTNTRLDTTDHGLYGTTGHTSIDTTTPTHIDNSNTRLWGTSDNTAIDTHTRSIDTIHTTPVDVAVAENLVFGTSASDIPEENLPPVSDVLLDTRLDTHLHPHLDTNLATDKTGFMGSLGTDHAIAKPLAGPTIDSVRGTDRLPTASPDPFKWQPDQ